VENVGNTEDSDVCRTDDVGKVLEVCREVSLGGPVVCVVVETGTDGDECVVNGVWELLGVSELVWATEVTVPLLVDLCVVVVLTADVD
jgi:hypothetical protein